MQVQIDFYGEVVTMPLPSTFTMFKNLVSHYYVLPEADVDELLFYFDLNGSKNPISSEVVYNKLLARPKGLTIKILVEVNQKSKLFKEVEQNIVDLDKRHVDLDKRDVDFEDILNFGDKVREMFIEQGEKIKEMMLYQGEKAKELWNCISTQPKKTQETLRAYKPELKVDETKKEINEEDYVVHTSILCDGCNVFPIIGNRYKCAVCKNFDYCEECEKKYGELHGHPFLKVRKPKNCPSEIQCHLYPC